MKIHPTAIVHPSAVLGEDVEVGPYAIVSGETTLGPGCVVGPHVVIEGKVTMGAENFLGAGTVIGAPPQDFAHSAEICSDVKIGDRNRFREHVTVHRGTKEGTSTVVGDDCFLMVGCHLAHNVRLGNSVIITNNCLLAGYVDVADHVVLGGGSVFHQFIRIGSRAMVAGLSAFNKDIPPFAMANFRNALIGLNRVGLRRAGFPREVKTEIDRAYRLLFRSGLTIRAALEESKSTTWSPEAQELLDFVAASKRGVIQMRRVIDAADETSEP
jgi:UDP-N-acetylglucosamine acyltransferase